MNSSESKILRKGADVYWLGEAGFSGVIQETSRDAVTIRWSNGHASERHHENMREIYRVPIQPRSV
jgi:hypothetical protein